jgi:hypothetical protein
MKPFSIARRKPEEYAALLDELAVQDHGRKDKRFTKSVRILRKIGSDDDRAQPMLDALLLIQEVELIAAAYRYCREHPGIRYTSARAAVRRAVKSSR